MRITVHAAKRFLERVMNKSNYTVIDVDFTLRYLTKLFVDVVPGSRYRPIIIPGFENFQAIYQENTIITILPKGVKHFYKN